MWPSSLPITALPSTGRCSPGKDKVRGSPLRVPQDRDLQTHEESRSGSAPAPPRPQSCLLALGSCPRWRTAHRGIRPSLAPLPALPSTLAASHMQVHSRQMHPFSRMHTHGHMLAQAHVVQTDTCWDMHARAHTCFLLILTWLESWLPPGEEKKRGQEGCQGVPRRAMS